jgi:hypothetical protein
MARRAARADRAGELHRVMLPGGYVDGRGRLHTEVVLAPLTGAVEQELAIAAAGGRVAALTTALLARAVVSLGTIARITPALVRELLVQDREYLLIRLRAMLTGPRMWVRLGCPSCAEEMELELALDELPVTRRPARARYYPFDGGVELRLPNGGDQEWAAASGLVGKAELRARLLARCARPTARARAAAARLDARRAERIEERMRELAPDVTPELDAACPHCASPLTSEIDLPFVILSEIGAAMRRIEEDVHLLAWNYHWSEGEILRLPRPRRDAYLRLVRAQLDANLDATMAG